MTKDVRCIQGRRWLITCVRVTVIRSSFGVLYFPTFKCDSPLSKNNDPSIKAGHLCWFFVWPVCCLCSLQHARRSFCFDRGVLPILQRVILYLSPRSPTVAVPEVKPFLNRTALCLRTELGWGSRVFWSPALFLSSFIWIVSSDFYICCMTFEALPSVRTFCSFYACQSRVMESWVPLWNFREIATLCTERGREIHFSTLLLVPLTAPTGFIYLWLYA